jgi:dienelactone hydrolase
MTDTAVAPGKPQALDDIMIAMDVVDTLRHREDLVRRELSEEDRETELIARLRKIYKDQGIDVPDSVLADGVKALWSRPYIDKDHVGIYGTSYGGYTSVMEIMRHPEVFAAASSSSPPTDWRNYDTIYTERFMGLPWDNENKSGYDAGSAMKYAKDLKGKLMLYYGTSDNNVHPSSTLQLVQALENAGKQYDMQVGPDRGHSGMNSNRMWEYMITHLIVSPPKDALLMAYRARSKRLVSASGR